ncbi:hypothetical protein Pcinc_014932 [Petrolisthes cinctipes]|uniref:C2H2-type domain-containing protein n=1 Tax=Petrolisthes cinctipes TaxID=88211 RepID=A0AAE1FTY1_PETCI|nr:hypothetical protein Pcinc_014932 [Petrolisthes cinctipes]
MTEKQNKKETQKQKQQPGNKPTTEKQNKEQYDNTQTRESKQNNQQTTENRRDNKPITENRQDNKQTKKKKHYESKRVICDKGGVVLRCATALKKRHKQKHLQKPKCSVCNVSYWSVKKLYIHQQKMHPDKFRCRQLWCLKMFDTRTELTHHHRQAHRSIGFMSCRYCGQKYVRGTYSEHLKQCEQDPIQRVKKFCQNCHQEIVCYSYNDFSKHQQECLVQNGNEHEAVTIRTGSNLGEAVHTCSVSGEPGHTGSISGDLVDTGSVSGELVNVDSYSERLVNDSGSNLIDMAEPVQTGSNSSNTSIEPGKILVHTGVYSTNQGKPEKVPQTVSNLTETTIESGEVLVQTGLNTTETAKSEGNPDYTGSTPVPSGSETQMKHKCHFCPKIFKNKPRVGMLYYLPIWTYRVLNKRVGFVVQKIQSIKDITSFKETY